MKNIILFQIILIITWVFLFFNNYWANNHKMTTIEYIISTILISSFFSIIIFYIIYAINNDDKTIEEENKKIINYIKISKSEGINKKEALEYIEKIKEAPEKLQKDEFKISKERLEMIINFLGYETYNGFLITNKLISPPESDHSCIIIPLWIISIIIVIWLALAIWPLWIIVILLFLLLWWRQ